MDHSTSPTKKSIYINNSNCKLIIYKENENGGKINQDESISSIYSNELFTNQLNINNQNHKKKRLKHIILKVTVNVRRKTLNWLLNITRKR